MRERITARVLLFDPDGRILLMKGRLPSAPNAPGVWFTVGGGVEPGECVLEAAAREIVEETGFTDAELGAVAWYNEAVLANSRGDPVLFKESYVLARCGGGEPSRDGWQELELALCDDIRWWSLEQIRAAGDERFYPERLPEMLEAALTGPPTDAPRVLARIGAQDAQ